MLALATSLCVWFLIWYIFAKRIGITFILPTPIEAFREFFLLLPQKTFISAVTGSLVRVIIGYIIGILFGALTAFSGFFASPLKAFFSPLINIARATPVSSFILICALFMPSNTTPTFISFLMVFPIVHQNVLTALEKSDSTLREITVIYTFSPFKRLTHFYIPSSLPYFGSACITSLGLAWKAGISAEVLVATSKSIGDMLYTSKIYFETEKVFAWTIAIIFISVILEYAVKGIAALVKHYTARRYGGAVNEK